MENKSVVLEIRATLKKSNTDNITELINIQLKVSGYQFRLNDEVSAALRDKLEAYNARKVADARHILTGEGTLGKKEAECVVNNKAERDAELETEVIYQTLRGFQKDTGDSLQILQQKVAQLRKEWELANKGV